jgi:hypothetical protein
MKKQFLISVLILSSITLLADNNLGQKKSNDKPKEEIKDVKNIIKLNLGQVGNNGAVGLSYEKMLNKNVSASLSIFGKYNSATIGSQNTEKTSGVGFMPEVRFYALPDYSAPRGLYLSAFYNYYSETYEVKKTDFFSNEETGSVKSTFNAVGATIGWMFRIKSSFVIDLSVGPAFESIDSPSLYDIKSSNGSVIRTEQSPNSKSSQLTGVFRFSLGYAF